MRRWVWDTMVLRLQWGDKPGEVGKAVVDLDASPDRSYLLTAGPSQVVVANNGSLCVTDTHNNRIQLFDARGRLQWCLGRRGLQPGEFSGRIRKALVGPTGDVYATQTRGSPRQPGDPPQWSDADKERWRSGVMCLTPTGEFKFSTHADPAFAAALGESARALRPPQDFWVDAQGRIYELHWDDGGLIACFRPDGKFDKLWRAGEDASPLVFGGPGQFYAISSKAVDVLPSGEWSHRLDVHRWKPDGTRLASLSVQTQGRTQHWYAELLGVGVDGSLVVQGVDEWREPDGTSLATKAIVMVLLISPNDEILARQNVDELYSRLLPLQARPKRGAAGIVVGGAGDLYVNPYSEKEYQIARFALTR